MKPTVSLAIFAALLLPALLAGQNDPTTYPAATELGSEALKRFDTQFDEQNVGFFHVYADPNVDPKETYLLRGQPMSEVAMALLPKKWKKKAKKLQADVFAAGAIRGMNENLYLVRFDGTGEDRIEMFAIRGSKVKHLKTLALMRKNGTQLKQMDTFITDVDGDSYLELMTLERGSPKQEVFVMTRPDRKWKKTTALDAPWDSAELFDPSVEK